MAMSSLIKSLEDIMRKDAGLNGDAQYIEQITWLLFLKAFDAKEMEWEFRPDYHGVIPEGYRWRDCLPFQHLCMWRSESGSNAQTHCCVASLAGRSLTC